MNYRQNKRGDFVKEAAAQNFERAFFRPALDDANHDFLRALHIFDSLPLSTQPSRLMLCSARVFTGGQPGSPIVVEAVQNGVAFEAELVIDELTLQYADQLGWEDRRAWLVNLPSILQAVSRRRIQDELLAAREKHFAAAEKFYQNLEQFAEKLSGTQSAVLQMGWGTGWNGMTIGPWLPKAVQNEARQKFELGRPPGQHGSWSPDLNRLFPQSRRLRALGETPGLPFGWLAVTLEPVGQPGKLWQVWSKQAGPKPISQPDAQTASPATPTVTAKPTATPSKAEPATKPLIASFSATPKPGDCFAGTVFSAAQGQIELEIPGLDADSQAYAVIGSKDWPFSWMPKDEWEVKCQVISVEKVREGYWRVWCQGV